MDDAKYEDRTRRTATWLVGISVGINLCGKKPKGWSNEKLAKMETHLPIAYALHYGNGWFNPIQIWEMVDYAKGLGFELSILDK